jgi:c-di-GMP-related signal transduction protein
MRTGVDVLLEQSIAVAIADLPLQPPVRDALLGVPGPARSLLDCVTAYEQGDWPRAMAAAQEAGVNMIDVADAYGEALHWTLALADARRAPAAPHGGQP